MRRRDIVFACVAWGGLLAGLAWALCTQSRWVQESAKPIQVTRPPTEDAERPEPAQTTATGVIGTVSEDSRAAMAQGLRSSKVGARGDSRPALAKVGQRSAPPEVQR
jgi:hypothetical protein